MFTAYLVEQGMHEENDVKNENVIHPACCFSMSMFFLYKRLALTHEQIEIATQHFHGGGRERIFPKYRNIAQGRLAAELKGENETNEKREMSQTF